jgi:Sortase domain
MAEDGGPLGSRQHAVRRLRGPLVPAIAALLLTGGGAAVAVGLLDQDAAPQPSATAPPDAVRDVVQPPGPSSQPSVGTTQPPTSTSLPTSGGTTTPPGAEAPLPVGISIPAIGVDSEMIRLGLAPDGTLQVPQPGPDYDKAAWYDGSPRPGETGPAVIEGHIDSAKNGPSVFFDLGALKAQDQITVRRQDGSTVRFVVDDVRSYPKSDFPILEVYGNTQGPELRLITCGGDFDRSSGHYRDNIVVFAHLA